MLTLPDTTTLFTRKSHQISRIKSSYELFCALIWNLFHFLPKFEFPLIQSSVSGAFSRVIYAPINVNPVGGGGGGVRARGGDLMPGAIPAVGLLIVRSDPGVGTFDFDRQKPGINSEAVTKSVPRGFLKVTLLEKGMKFSFVLIAIIRYFKLSSKQIMSILKKF